MSWIQVKHRREVTSSYCNRECTDIVVIDDYSTNSGENSVGAYAGADTVHVSKCGTYRVM